jgi:hypothetical protein
MLRVIKIRLIISVLIQLIFFYIITLLQFNLQDQKLIKIILHLILFILFSTYLINYFSQSKIIYKELIIHLTSLTLIFELSKFIPHKLGLLPNYIETPFLMTSLVPVILYLYVIYIATSIINYFKVKKKNLT